VFRRKNSQTDDKSAEDSAAVKPGGKGRPTPRRADAEAKNRRPLVPDNRGAAKQARKKATVAQREKTRQALLTGDERNMPPRDKGPARRWVRDYVDARWNLGEFFLPVSLVVVIATLLVGNNGVAAFFTIIALYAIVIISVVDAFILGRFIKKGLARKFDEDDIPAGTRMYGVMRSFQIRRTRLPKPQVKRGQYPS